MAYDGIEDLENLVQELLNNSNQSHQGAEFTPTRGNVLDNTLIILAYSVLSVIAVFGNSLVCYVIFKNKRLHTATNFFIANLAVSDLLVTCVNVPFNIVKHVLRDWPFGEVLCHLVNFSLMVSTYVSTYTLTSIALDRHRVVLKPLSPRMSKTLAACILVVIWVIAIVLSLPYGIFMRVKEGKFILEEGGKYGMRISKRCVGNYPKFFEQYLTVATFVLQYCLPLTLTGVAYGRIVQRLWFRTHVGAVTANQQQSQTRAKMKSIKLLIAVVVVFALCWLPLNLYHLLTDWHPNPKVFGYNINAFFACHWIATSSTCYNPFIYCWLNENFREEVKNRFRCCRRWRMKFFPVDGDEANRRRPKLRRIDASMTRSSMMISTARTQSVLRRDVTLISDQDEGLQSLKQASDGFVTEESGDREEEEGYGGVLEEAKDLLSVYENGRVEFHNSKVHNCLQG